MNAKVMKQALDALEYHTAQTRSIAYSESAMTALREAITAHKIAAPKAAQLINKDLLKQVIGSRPVDMLTKGELPHDPRFLHTYCSQCDRDLGPGFDGVDMCYRHTPISITTAPTVSKVLFAVANSLQLALDTLPEDLKRKSSSPGKGPLGTAEILRKALGLIQKYQSHTKENLQWEDQLDRECG